MVAGTEWVAGPNDPTVNAQVVKLLELLAGLDSNKWSSMRNSSLRYCALLTEEASNLRILGSLVSISELKSCFIFALLGLLYGGLHASSWNGCQFLLELTFPYRRGKVFLESCRLYCRRCGVSDCPIMVLASEFPCENYQPLGVYKIWIGESRDVFRKCTLAKNGEHNLE